MTFIVRTMTAPCEDKELISSIITHLANNGYDPLIVLAKQQFLGVFGKNVTREAILQDLQPGSPVPTFDSDHVLRLSSVIYNADQGLLMVISSVPLTGTAFFMFDSQDHSTFPSPSH